jgi:TrmH family RNA methyltransferase
MKKLLPPTKAQIKLWEKLRIAKTRCRENLFLAEGLKVVTELFKGSWDIEALLVREEKEGCWNALEGDIAARQVTTYVLPAKQWQSLSQDKTPEGIMAVVKSRSHHDLPGILQQTAGHALLLDRINNPNNLGALMRTALWFGIRLILISKGSVDFTNPKVVRSSMGSLFHMTIIDDLDFREILADIKRHFVVIGSHVQGGMMPHPCQQRTALLFGNESHGLAADLQQVADETWHIPGGAYMESLSLPQAAAVILYECTRNDWNGGAIGSFHTNRHHHG